MLSAMSPAASTPSWPHSPLSSDQWRINGSFRQAFDQPDRACAGETWRKVADQLRPRWPKLAELVDNSEHDVLAYMGLRPFLPWSVHWTAHHLR